MNGIKAVCVIGASIVAGAALGAGWANQSVSEPADKLAAVERKQDVKVTVLDAPDRLSDSDESRISFEAKRIAIPEPVEEIVFVALPDRSYNRDVTWDYLQIVHPELMEGATRPSYEEGAGPAGTVVFTFAEDSFMYLFAGEDLVDKLDFDGRRRSGIESRGYENCHVEGAVPCLSKTAEDAFGEDAPPTADQWAAEEEKKENKAKGVLWGGVGGLAVSSAAVVALGARRESEEAGRDNIAESVRTFDEFDRVVPEANAYVGVVSEVFERPSIRRDWERLRDEAYRSEDKVDFRRGISADSSHAAVSRAQEGAYDDTILFSQVRTMAEHIIRIHEIIDGDERQRSKLIQIMEEDLAACRADSHSATLLRQIAAEDSLLHRMKEDIGREDFMDLTKQVIAQHRDIVAPLRVRVQDKVWKDTLWQGKYSELLSFELGYILPGYISYKDVKRWAAEKNRLHSNS